MIPKQRILAFIFIEQYLPEDRHINIAAGKIHNYFYRTFFT